MAIHAIAVCIPVFTMIALGVALRQYGIVGESQRAFIRWIVYYIALPLLIIHGVSTQDPTHLAKPELLLGLLTPVIAVATVFFLMSWFLRIRGAIAAVFVFGSFWSNSAYMGFPLALGAFGDVGFERAAVYNAVCTPAFILLGFLFIGLQHVEGMKQSIWTKIRLAFLNPLVLSGAMGLLIAWGLHQVRLPDGTYALPESALLIGGILDRTISLAGSMGPPLALIAIGAALRLDSVCAHAPWIALVAAGKLILLPAVTLLGFAYLFPVKLPEMVEVTILLHATPCAVASYVIAAKIGADGFASAVLVVSTALSIITLPAWLWAIDALLPLLQSCALP